MEQLTEKIAYLAGLAEGLDIDTGKKEGKLLMAIVDALGDIAKEMRDIVLDVADLSDLVDEIDEDLGNVEDEIYPEEDCCCCGEEDDDDDYFEITCPNCDEEIYVDGEMLESNDEIVCPNCGEPIELEICCDCEDCDCEDCNE